MTTSQVIYTVAGVAVTLAFAVFAVQLTARDKYESAEYEVVRSDGKFEIRQYPELTVAITEMATRGEGDNGSFMRLFKYISGENQPQQKIAMTTPVFMDDETEDEKGTMAFVLPKEVAEDEVPDPTGKGVQIKTRAAGKFAVYRFSGRMNPESIKAAETTLRQWMKENQLTAQDDYDYAGYDPPWTPGPMRRNEILIRLNDDAELADE